MLSRRVPNGGVPSNVQGHTGQQPIAAPTAVVTANAQPPASALTFPSLLSAVWRRKWMVILCIVLGLGGAWAYIFRTIPTYSTSSLLCVQPNGPRIITDQLGYSNTSSTYLYTQVELIRSTAIVSAALTSPSAAHCKALRDVSNRAGYLKHALDVAVNKQGDLITVSVETPYADDSAMLTNSVVDAYVTFQNRQQHSTAAEVLRILQESKNKLDQDLKATSDAVVEFMRKNGTLSFAGEKGNVVTQRLGQLSDSWAAAQMESLNARIAFETADQLKDDPGKLKQLITTRKAKGEAIGFVDKNSDRAVELEQLERRKALMKMQFGAQHPAIATIDAQISILQAEIQEGERQALIDYLAVLKTQWMQAQVKEADLSKAYEAQKTAALDLNASAAEYAQLEATQRRLEKQEDTIDARIRELNLAESSTLNPLNISVLEPARPEVATVKPQPQQVMAIAGVMGLMIGLGMALMLDLLDQRLRTIDEVATIMEMPVLGAIPTMSGSQTPIQRGQQVHLQPRSPVAEAYRAIRTAVYFGAPGGARAKVILVTSPSPRDGKSTVASNLSIVIAQGGRRVLLIDCDCRKPTQHAIFGVASETGVANVLLGKDTLERAIQQTSIDELDILPCGPLPLNPSELLDSKAFKDLLAKTAAKYDQIIIDSPPIAPVTDGRIIAASADATLLVLRTDKSTRRLATHTRDLLDSVGANLLGVVVNGVAVTRQGGYYGYGHYQYGYGRKETGGDAPRTKEVRAITVRSEASPDAVPAAPPASGANGKANGNGHARTAATPTATVKRAVVQKTVGRTEPMEKSAQPDSGKQ